MKRSQSFPRVTLKHGKYWGVHSIYCALSFRVRFKQLPGTCTEMGKHCWVLGVPIVTGFQRLPSLCLLNLCTATILWKFSAHERGEAPPSPKCLLSLGILRIKRRTYDHREGRDCRYACFYLCMCMYTCVQVPTEALGWYWNHRSWSHRWLRVTQHRCWEPNSSFLQGRQAFLPTGPFFQPLYCYLFQWALP